MPNLTAIQHRLTQLCYDKPDLVLSDVVAQLRQQGYLARLDAQQVADLCARFHLTPVELALRCIQVAACYALVPVSHFYVGAVAIGQSGQFYFGANQEFADAAMQQTVHAEQSAIMHAWLAGESGLTDMVVNYTPCGHCRQFMNELNSAGALHIHLPHSQHHRLHSYLPDAFGPKDLGIERVLFDSQDHGYPIEGDALQQAARCAMNQAYAPYSQAYSGVALQAGEQVIIGRYAENAAFNPSFLPLQGALNLYRLSGNEKPISRVVFCEKHATLSHQAMTAQLAEAYLQLPIEVISVA